MNCKQLYDRHSSEFSKQTGFTFEKLCKKIDEKNIALQSLTFDDFADILYEMHGNTTVSTTLLRQSMSCLLSIYRLSDINPPQWTENMDIYEISSKIISRQKNWGFFKDINSVISHIDKLNWGTFVNDAKVAYILAFHNVLSAEAVEIKKNDIDLNKKTIKTSKHGVLSFSDFEMKIIDEYINCNYYTTPVDGRKIFLESSEYLFRPVNGRGDKMTAVGLRTKLKKVNDGFKSKDIYPLLSTEKLSVNGDFYRVYTYNISPFVFDKNRKVQYNQYVDTFWKQR